MDWMTPMLQRLSDNMRVLGCLQQNQLLRIQLDRTLMVEDRSAPSIRRRITGDSRSSCIDAITEDIGALIISIQDCDSIVHDLRSASTAAGQRVRDSATAWSRDAKLCISEARMGLRALHDSVYKDDTRIRAKLVALHQRITSFVGDGAPFNPSTALEKQHVDVPEGTQ